MNRKLTKGDIVGLICPCTYADKTEYIDIKQGIESLGLVIKEGTNLYKRTYSYAATEQERADDINEMFRDPSVKMVFFGGGNVGSELLDLIDYDLIQKNPKLVASASNGTTILNMIYTKTGLPAYYGMFPNAFKNLTEFDRTHFINAFMNNSEWSFSQSSKWISVKQGQATGTLIGGFSTLFPYFFGSKLFSFDKSKKYILFLENHPVFIQTEEIEAQIDFIAQSGFMDCVSGLLFGTYTDDEEQCQILLQILSRFSNKYNIPCVKCDDFGHGERHGIIPIGLTAILNSSENNCSLTCTKSLY